jgi:CTP synthase (UTP-ammonia lyase)
MPELEARREIVVMETAIALVGDRSERVPAHVALPRALSLAAQALGAAPPQERWLSSVQAAECSDTELEAFSGIWLVPGTPYASMQGALRAIRFARERQRPFLGTCGGFQHALIEYARHALGVVGAEHAESSPGAPLPLIERLSCSLAGVRARVKLIEGSRLSRAYDGATVSTESYNCNYGLSPAGRDIFSGSLLRFSAFDEEGGVRGFELDDHAFFIGTLFQPELTALKDEVHPVIVAFVRAALVFATRAG